ncbi:hypothetical protein IV203_038442 [Nitzschia inconspicua]|uniref:Uncharacterized protein n=1 Tax=Nitzschia inconspicua TaxID=303405 RepID=A0A9K3LMK6_9STRA|nr:hypothetical protein IV203_038442 [Nitzschia inconspicua]
MEPTMKEDDSRVVVEEQAQDQRTWERSPKRMKWCMVGVAVLLLVAGIAVAITMCLNNLQETDEEGTTSGFIVVAPTPDLVVTSCGPDTVVVTGDRVGDLVPNSNLVFLRVDAELCLDCTPMLRHIISIEASPEPNTFILTTRFLTFGQVMPKEMYDPLLVNTEIELAFECSHSRMDEGSNHTRHLVANKSRRVLQSFPQTCGGWTEIIQTSGKCLHTDCWYGLTGSPLDNTVGQVGNSADCFSCGRKNGPGGSDGCNNGCGPDNGPVFDGDFAALNSGEHSNFTFGEACCSHDYCYSSSTFDKKTCDKIFYQMMRQSCPRPWKFGNTIAQFLPTSFSKYNSANPADRNTNTAAHVVRPNDPAAWNTKALFYPNDPAAWNGTPSIPTTNDSCEGGATLLDFSTATPGITGLSSNVPNELCGARGVPTDTGAWYSYVGGGTLTTVTTCSSSEGDVIPSVYNSNCVCVEEIERYAGFEEAGTWTTSYDCPSDTKRSAVSWYSVAEEEYHIWVHDLDVDASRFEIVVRRMRRMSSRRLSRSSNY